jgi:hypothetical protein
VREREGEKKERVGWKIMNGYIFLGINRVKRRWRRIYNFSIASATNIASPDTPAFQFRFHDSLRIAVMKNKKKC